MIYILFFLGLTVLFFFLHLILEKWYLLYLGLGFFYGILFVILDINWKLSFLLSLGLSGIFLALHVLVFKRKVREDVR
ncbi:MAG: hypothetical protein DRQ03_01310 [Candidatus Hydrothermota bacterium]|nr:MAG: hypothetical protein DRQ03_01310 [Candidatus Hydrothermae bacterium]